MGDSLNCSNSSYVPPKVCKTLNATWDTAKSVAQKVQAIPEETARFWLDKKTVTPVEIGAVFAGAALWPLLIAGCGESGNSTTNTAPTQPVVSTVPTTDPVTTDPVLSTNTDTLTFMQLQADGTLTKIDKVTTSINGIKDAKLIKKLTFDNLEVYVVDGYIEQTASNPEIRGIFYINTQNGSVVPAGNSSLGIRLVNGKYILSTGLYKSYDDPSQKAKSMSRMAPAVTTTILNYVNLSTGAVVTDASIITAYQTASVAIPVSETSLLIAPTAPAGVPIPVSTTPATTTIPFSTLDFTQILSQANTALQNNIAGLPNDKSFLNGYSYTVGQTTLTFGVTELVEYVNVSTQPWPDYQPRPRWVLTVNGIPEPKSIKQFKINNQMFLDIEGYVDSWRPSGYTINLYGHFFINTASTKMVGPGLACDIQGTIIFAQSTGLATSPGSMMPSDTRYYDPITGNELPSSICNFLSIDNKYSAIGIAEKALLASSGHMPTPMWDGYMNKITKHTTLQTETLTYLKERIATLTALYGKRLTLPSGLTGLFIQNPAGVSFPNEITSEAMAYYMTLLARMAEIDPAGASTYQNQFQEVLNGVQHMITLALQNGNGGAFPAWLVTANNTTVSIPVVAGNAQYYANSASDADMDIIKALVYAIDLADKGLWTDNGYTSLATTLIDAARYKSATASGLFRSDTGRYILKPSEDWFDYFHFTDYLAPATYKELADFARKKNLGTDIATFWDKAATDSIQLYQAVLTQTGQFPSRVTVFVDTGGHYIVGNSGATNQSYDGIRSPWRISEYLINQTGLTGYQDFNSAMLKQGENKSFNFTNTSLDDSMYLGISTLNGHTVYSPSMMDLTLNKASVLDSDYYTQTLKMLSLLTNVFPRSTAINLSNITFNDTVPSASVSLKNPAGDWNKNRLAGTLSGSTLTLQGNSVDSDMFSLMISPAYSKGEFSLDVKQGTSTFSWGSAMFKVFINDSNATTTPLLPSNRFVNADGYINAGDGLIKFVLPANASVTSINIMLAAGTFGNFQITPQFTASTSPILKVPFHAGWNLIPTHIFKPGIKVSEAIQQLAQQGITITEALDQAGVNTGPTINVNGQHVPTNITYNATTKTGPDFTIQSGSAIYVLSTITGTYKASERFPATSYLFKPGFNFFSIDSPMPYDLSSLSKTINAGGTRLKYIFWEGWGTESCGYRVEQNIDFCYFIDSSTLAWGTSISPNIGYTLLFDDTMAPFTWTP